MIPAMYLDHLLPSPTDTPPSADISTQGEAAEVEQRITDAHESTAECHSGMDDMTGRLRRLARRISKPPPLLTAHVGER
jgi:hypothetical protein